MTVIRAIICKECGVEGGIEVPEMDSGNPSAILFRYLGHDPFSGHMHYQCPACKMVLLVDPMTILAGFISIYSRVDMRGDEVKTPGHSPLVKSLL